MQIEFGERRDILEGKAHWRFRDLQSAPRLLGRLRFYFEGAGCRCSGDAVRLIGQRRWVKYEAEIEDDHTLSIFADYGRQFTVFPIAATVAFLIFGLVLAIRSGDWVFLSFGVGGLAIGMVGYLIDIFAVPNRQRRIFKRIIDAAEAE